MKNVIKFLATVVVCGSAMLPSFTAPGAPVPVAHAETADTAVEAVEPESVGGHLPEPNGKKIIEIFTDRCSTSVVIKSPYPDPDDSSTPSEPQGKDIILARSEGMCGFINGSSLTNFTGVCQHNPNKKSAWTEPTTYLSVMDSKNATRRFRWFCGQTRERSRCKKGTTHVQFRLMPGDEFQTRCLK